MSDDTTGQDTVLRLRLSRLTSEEHILTVLDDLADRHVLQHGEGSFKAGLRVGYVHAIMGLLGCTYAEARQLILDGHLGTRRKQRKLREAMR